LFWDYAQHLKKKSNKKLKVWVHFIGLTILLFAFYFYLFGTPNIIGYNPHVLYKKKKRKRIQKFVPILFGQVFTIWPLVSLYVNHLF